MSPVLPVLRWVASLLGPLVIVYIVEQVKRLCVALRGYGVKRQTKFEVVNES